MPVSARARWMLDAVPAVLAFADDASERENATVAAAKAR
jgi:hypothetical protein